MKAAKYIAWHAPYQRTEDIDDLFLFFKIRRTRLTIDLYSLMLKHSRPFLHEYIRNRTIKFTNSGVVPPPVSHQKGPEAIKPSVRKLVRNTEPAKGLSQDDPIKKATELHRMNSVALNNHPKDNDYEYGLSDW